MTTARTSTPRKTVAKPVTTKSVPPLPHETELLLKQERNTTPLPPTNGMELVYPKLEVVEYSTTTEDGPVTSEMMKDLLGWETEKEYQARKLKDNPENKATDFLFYDDYHCLNTSGEKVRCHNNAGNRPFDMEWCKDLIRMILNGEWAGPLTIPGETVNGETIRISKYGRVLSGQHQGTALILADEYLQNSRDKEVRKFYDPNDPDSELYKFWYGHDHVVIETYIITGLSEDERVLRTIDYVKQRTMADVLFTMDLYRNNSPVERKEMTRMLEKAIDLLWTRTGAQGYRTHPELVGFLERHKTLLDCVEHLFMVNKPILVGSKKRQDGETDQQHALRIAREAASGGRRISKLKLSAGHCAALCYLMGCSKLSQEEIDNYKGVTADGIIPPHEKHLNWDLLDRAKLFWTNLAGDRTFAPVRFKINSLYESKPDNNENQGLGGRTEERFVVLAKTWDIFKDHPVGDPDNPPFPFEIDPETSQIVSEDLEPNGALWLYYTNLDPDGKELPPGEVRFLDIADFKGIDCPNEGSKKQAKKETPPAAKDPTPEEIYRQGEEIRHQKLAKQDEKKEEKKATKRRIVRK